MAVMIPLTQLRAHPHNSNVMPADRLRKLAAHIAESGHYPPLIVRPLDVGVTPPTFQLLDGHHRALALKQLGHRTAACEVWNVDDAQALLLLATLNRLEGDDDPLKRATLLDELCRHRALPDLAAHLPETIADLRELLSLRSAPPPPVAARRLDDMPVAVHFFLLPAQRRALEAKLRTVEASREAALLQLLDIG